MKNNKGCAAVEFFHLLFLSFIGKKVDKQSYALKGGCNLRFFFHSPRYSEDMDIDINDIPVYVLQEKVNSILQSTPFHQALMLNKIRIEHVTEHKQSETTQRWKLGLLVANESLPLPTKIEFSRRGFCSEPVYERISPAISHQHKITPFMCSHYTMFTACRQKIEALASRSVTQARDVFDLFLIGADEMIRDAVTQIKPGIMEAAAINIANLTFEHFKSQVIPYLQPDDQRTYNIASMWEQMQLELIDRLEMVK